jgi:hypothetical protein
MTDWGKNVYVNDLHLAVKTAVPGQCDCTNDVPDKQDSWQLIW